METETQIVDYESAAKKLKEAQDRPPFWNPKAGKHEVVILSELTTYSFQEKDKQGNLVFTPDGKPVAQVRAKVDVEARDISDNQIKKYVWSFGIGATEASLYGQLIAYARNHGNKLTGSKITLVVKSDGKKRDFTVV